MTPDPELQVKEPEKPKAAGSFTGRKRRTTRRSVRIIDRIARVVICTGGIGVVFAFAGIVTFLISVVIPLFHGAKLEKLSNATLKSQETVAATQATTPQPLTMGLDESVASAWILDSDGVIRTYRTAGGQLVKSDALGGGKITSFSNNRGDISLGYEDGAVRVGRIGQDLEYLDSKALPDTMEAILPGQTVAFKDGVATMTGAGQVRIVRTSRDLSEPLAIGDKPFSSIVLSDYLYTDRLEVLTAMRADGRLYFATITKKENVMTGKIKRTLQHYELPLPKESVRPISLMLGLNGRLVFLVFENGRFLRFNTDHPDSPYVAEDLSLLNDSKLKVSGVRMLLGNLTLIVADSGGGVTGWFPAPTEEKAFKDGLKMARAHVLEKQPAPATVIATSARDRQFVTADEAGNVYVRHMTSGTTQGKLKLSNGSAISLMEMAPKNDAVAVLDKAGTLNLFRLDNPHADGSMAQLFTPIHYEGYPKPAHVYQSSAGTDDAELKMGLVPLIIGTMKATFYAMLFAIPIAILGAIYTSEFMQPQVRATVKPLVEMMASLPSVVLGFIGALVFAPFVENTLMAVLLAFASVPLGVTAFGFIWQLLPPHFVRSVPGSLRFGIMLALVVLAIWVSFSIAPVVEQVVFYGDLKAWLGKRIGSGTPGWLVILTPLLFVATTIFFNLKVKSHLKIYQGPTTRFKAGMIDVARYAITFSVALLVAWLVALILGAMGWDLRDSFMGSYVQRNSLIVGMLMGFAIIPIIYTVSEDALSTVPNTLRSAALGAGATPWQTAIKVVLPVATSGIFSACMIGFGRAAGETMIVLMASGRTPIIDMNLFNGLSALSANIATELPEAPVNSTHYRVLFLSALVLFVLTFIVNTTAEIIRIRFRKRAYQL